MNTLENIVYTVTDLAAAKAVHAALLGAEPHSDESYYVGFHVDGTEIGLTPVRGDGSATTVAHVRVADLDAALAEVVAAGATVVTAPHGVGGGARVATVSDGGGSLLGLIQRD